MALQQPICKLRLKSWMISMMLKSQFRTIFSCLSVENPVRMYLSKRNVRAVLSGGDQPGPLAQLGKVLKKILWTKLITCFLYLSKRKTFFYFPFHSVLTLCYVCVHFHELKKYKLLYGQLMFLIF